MILKRLVHITCKKATYLISKHEEQKITLIEWMRLKFHLAICSFCKQFQKQTRFIGEHAHNAQEFHSLKLTDYQKESIKQLLKN